jgi:hypothetical protein
LNSSDTDLIISPTRLLLVIPFFIGELSNNGDKPEGMLDIEDLEGVMLHVA